MHKADLFYLYRSLFRNNKSRTENYFSIFVIPVPSLLIINGFGAISVHAICYTYTYIQYRISLCKLTRCREIFVTYCITLTLLKTKCLLSMLSVCLQLGYAWQAVGPFCVCMHTVFWRHSALLTHLMGRGGWGEDYGVFSI